MDAQGRYQAWLSDPLIDGATKAELTGLTTVEIEDRFFRWLEFGTGGLRGRVEAGSNRMNVYTVRLVTQALANYLLAADKGSGGVAIAHDSRHMSREFTQAAAEVLVGNGIPVYVFADLAPTPLLSYAVRYFQASAGIVITASHNPPQYNGYKVYNERGNQLLPEDALLISSQMAQLGLEKVQIAAQARQSRLWRSVGEEVIQSYYERLLEIVPTGVNGRSLNILFTPLHGTGGRFVPEILGKAGFVNVSTVDEQMIPDGDFPTVEFPNPEDPAAFELAFAQARAAHYDLIIATDPDADRMGVAVRQDHNWVLLTGNQLGVLLTDYILDRLDPAARQGAVVIKTIVTTDMVAPIVRKYGGELRQTLTGFKYIGTLIDELPAEGLKFIFGFEDSYGYLAGDAVRDKDAVLASLLIAEVAAFYQNLGLTLLDRLAELFSEHGYYLQENHSYTFATSLEAERSKAFIAELRQAPIESIGGERVLELLDYENSIRRDLSSGAQSALDFPREGVLQWITERGSKITLRLSGTEPKMKLYFEVHDPERIQAEERVASLKNAFDDLVQKGLQR